MWSKIWNPSNRKVLCLNIVSAFALNLFLEYMERKSVAALLAFMEERTFVFLYNALIIFVTLSIVFIVKKKYFWFGLLFSFWGMIGLANGVILNSRNTPFTAVDLTIAKSTIPVITNYFAVWEIVLALIAMTAGIAGLVTLFLYCPNARKSFDFRTNVVLVAVLVAFFAVASYFGVGRGQLISKFDNLIAGYEDYGVAYSFCITAIDTGVDRPIDYSKERIAKLKKLMDKRQKKLTKGEEKRTPNIIFIQLESFFDITDVKNISLSEDPLPNLHALQKETTSGYVTVPVYGAGTINTEFEMICAMSIDDFGTGEYPYRSILHKTSCESMAYWLKDLGYNTAVIHNNNASFYDRDYVFSNLGFDYFISSENMNIKSYNEAGWPKDAILTEEIMDMMTTTSSTDYIYTISVQGHGDYPENPVQDPEITVDGEGWSDSYRNTVTYYVNQIHEMDEFIGELTKVLSEYDEETVLVVYGDHLPSLDLESEDLKSGSKYKTPYFIWDNFGYNSSHKDELSGNVKAYQMPSKVLGELGIHNGIMNEYHQTMEQSDNYRKNMKLFEYDLLYGGRYSTDGEAPEPGSPKHCIREVKVNEIKKSGDYGYILGENFTDYSRVYVNGNMISTEKMSSQVLRVPLKLLPDKAELVVHQVSKTNENTTYNMSNTFTVNTDLIEPIYKSEE